MRQPESQPSAAAMTLSCFSTSYSPQHPLSASHLPQGRPIPVTHNAQLNSSNSLELMKNPHISPLFKKKPQNMQALGGCPLQMTIFMCFARAASYSAPGSQS